MKKFIVLYTAPMSAMEQMQSIKPEDSKGIMDSWMAWADKNKVSVLDLGTPLGNAVKITKDGESEVKGYIVGYSLMQADSMDAVKEMLKAHPHLNMPGGCDIEVHESLPMPGME